MPHIVLDCPYCMAQQMSMHVHHRATTRDNRGIAFAQCGKCTMPVTAMIQLGPKPRVSSIQAWTSHGNDVIEDAGAIVIEVFPKTAVPSAPKHVDPALGKIFIQAQNARSRKDHHVAGMGFIKAVDIALKVYDPNLSGDLRNRIDALEERHDITPAMKTWAHQVRLTGNEAAHESDEPSQADIDAMASFSEMLLTYLFTLPAEVKARTRASLPQTTTVAPPTA